MVAFVGDEIARIFRRRRKSDGGQNSFPLPSAWDRALSCRPCRPRGSAPPRSRPCRDRPHVRACRRDASSRPSSWRSSPPDRSCSSSLRWRASYLCAYGRAGSGRRSSASRHRFPWPSASASRDSFRHCHGARSSAAPRWLPSSTRRRRAARPSPDHARRRASGRRRTLSRALRAADGCASSTTRNDREPCRACRAE